MGPRKRSSVPATVSPDDLTTIMGALNPRYTSNRRMRAMVALMYATGLRVGEACALEADSVDRNAGTVNVPHVAGLTKTGGRVVGLPLSPLLDEALDAWEAVRDTASPHYFHTSTGGRVDTSQVRRRLGQIAEQVGLPDVHPHTMRHTFGRNLVAAGVPITVVQNALGHSDLSSTMVYTRVAESEQVNVLRGVTLPL